MKDSRNALVFDGFYIFTTETHICRSPWVGDCPSDQVAQKSLEHAGKYKKHTEQFAEPGLKKVWNTGQDITIILAVRLDGSVLHYTFSLCLLQKPNCCYIWKYCPPIRALMPGTSEADSQIKEGNFGVRGQTLDC